MEAKDLFYPFNSRQHQYIVTETLKAELDFDKLIKHGVIADHFPVHNSDRDNILTSWSEYKWRLQSGFVSSRFMDNIQPLNVIKDYYGEKMAFYFAWLIHYTGWLIPLSFVAIIYTSITIEVRMRKEDVHYENLLNTEVSFVYCIAVVIWLTLFNVSWRRK